MKYWKPCYSQQGEEMRLRKELVVALFRKRQLICTSWDTNCKLSFAPWFIPQCTATGRAASFLSVPVCPWTPPSTLPCSISMEENTSHLLYQHRGTVYLSHHEKWSSNSCACVCLCFGLLCSRCWGHGAWNSTHKMNCTADGTLHSPPAESSGALGYNSLACRRVPKLYPNGHSLHTGTNFREISN